MTISFNLAVHSAQTAHVQSPAIREIRPVQKNQTSSLPLGTYSFAALLDPSNTFKEGKLTT